MYELRDPRSIPVGGGNAQSEGLPNTNKAYKKKRAKRKKKKKKKRLQQPKPPPPRVGEMVLTSSPLNCSRMAVFRTSVRLRLNKKHERTHAPHKCPD